MPSTLQKTPAVPTRRMAFVLGGSGVWLPSTAPHIALSVCEPGTVPHCRYRLPKYSDAGQKHSRNIRNCPSFCGMSSITSGSARCLRGVLKDSAAQGVKRHFKNLIRLFCRGLNDEYNAIMSYTSRSSTLNDIGKYGPCRGFMQLQDMST